MWSLVSVRFVFVFVLEVSSMTGGILIHFYLNLCGASISMVNSALNSCGLGISLVDGFKSGFWTDFASIYPFI